MNNKFASYIKKFNDLLEIRDLTNNTIINYNSFLKQYLNWIDDHHKKRPEDVSYDEIRSYILYLKNVRNLAATSINAHISQLKFFHLYVLYKPFDKYQVPFMKTTRKLPTIVSKAEIFYFIDSLKNPKHKAFAALLYSSGIRVSELVHIRYEDISRKRMQIHIKKTKSRSDRYVILSTKALAIITTYWYAANKPRGFLFPNQTNGNHITTSTVYNVLKNHSRDINFPINLTPHFLRHHFGTHLYEDGNDLLTIQKLLGHKSIQSTTIYVQLSNPHIMKIISPFDREDK